MKVAVAVWKGRISPVFDVSRYIVVLDIEKGTILKRNEETFRDEDPVSKTYRLAMLGINLLICGAVSQNMAGMLAAHGIRTISFIAGDMEDVIAAYLAGNLPNPAMTMPGRCGPRHRRHRRRRRW